MESKKEPEKKVTLSCHTNYVQTVCFSPDQTKLCSAGTDNKVILTNLQNNQTEKVFTGHRGTIYGSDFSCDGEFLITGSRDKIIRIWKVSGSESGNSIKLEGHKYNVNCVLYLQNDPNHVISCSDDKTIKLWSVEQKKEISSLQVESYVECVDILPDNTTLVSGGEEYQMIRIWDLRSGKCVQTLDHHINDVNSVQFHPDSFSLASGSDDTTIKIFDFRTFKLLQNYQEHCGWVTSVGFHPSGKYLISGSDEETIIVYDLFEKKNSLNSVLFTLEDHSDDVNCVKFSPDGRFFASASDDMTVILWNFPLGRMIHEHTKDIDEEERVKYLIQKDLLLDADEYDCWERNVLKIKIDDFRDDFCSLYCYKFFCVCCE